MVFVRGVEFRVAQPPLQHAMHRLHADDRAGGLAPLAGTTANGLVCGPPSPPWEPMNSSNGATSSATGSYMLLTRMSGQWGKLSWRRRWSAARGVEVGERILSLDEVVAQAPPPFLTDHERAMRL